MTSLGNSCRKKLHKLKILQIQLQRYLFTWQSCDDGYNCAYAFRKYTLKSVRSGENIHRNSSNVGSDNKSCNSIKEFSRSLSCEPIINVIREAEREQSLHQLGRCWSLSCLFTVTIDNIWDDGWSRQLKSEVLESLWLTFLLTRAQYQSDNDGHRPMHLLADWRAVDEESDDAKDCTNQDCP